MKNTILAFLFMVLSMSVPGQSVKYTPSVTRKVVVISGDTTIICNVYNTWKNFKTRPECKYYWLFENTIHWNYGGYQGQLLHGEFSALNKNNNLIYQGYFINGLKDGEWKYWSGEGIILRSETWKNGIRHGRSFYYDPSGNMISEIKYRNGKLKEKPVETSPDSIKNKKHRTTVKEDKKSHSFLIFGHKNSKSEVVPVSEQPFDNTESNTTEETKEKKPLKELFKISFRKNKPDQENTTETPREKRVNHENNNENNRNTNNSQTITEIDAGRNSKKK